MRCPTPVGPLRCRASVRMSLGFCRSISVMSGGGSTQTFIDPNLASPWRLCAQVYWHHSLSPSSSSFMRDCNSSPAGPARTDAEFPKQVMIAPCAVFSITITPLAASSPTDVSQNARAQRYHLKSREGYLSTRRHARCDSCCKLSKIWSTGFRV